MKRTLLRFFALFLALIFITGACKKKDDDSDDNNTPVTTNWHLNVQVDLGGVFTVLATAAITVTAGTSFSAAITTSQIGGAAEVHNFTLTGTISSGICSLTANQTFNITNGGYSETVTMLTGTHSATNNALTGSGTCSVLPSGAPAPVGGTYTVTGTL
jgi:hypothetical protein